MVSVKTYLNQTVFGCCEGESFVGSDATADVSTLIAADMKQITKKPITLDPLQ